MKYDLPNKITDERGYIQDILNSETFDSITMITMVTGAVRGNHYHKLTSQWTYLIEGEVEVATKAVESVAVKIENLSSDYVHLSPPNICHALRALKDSKILIITKGPRSGFDYETDTFRLSESLFE